MVLLISVLFPKMMAANARIKYRCVRYESDEAVGSVASSAVMRLTVKLSSIVIVLLYVPLAIKSGRIKS